MKKLFCLFLITGFLSANGQDEDLIVKTDLDSIRCSIRSIIGTGSFEGAIKYSLIENPQEMIKINKRRVFYIQNGVFSAKDTKEEPSYFNTNFDYTHSYFLKTGDQPPTDDPYQRLVTGEKIIARENIDTGNVTPPQEWKYRAGKNLKTAGGLLLGSAVLSFLGTLVLSQPQMSQPVSGYVLLGAGGVSMLTGYGFLIVAGNAMQNN